MPNITFVKSGKEVKAAISNRKTQLQQRLAKRNQELDLFLQDSSNVRSYLIRANEYAGMHHGGRGGYRLYGQDDISSEERQEIDQLCLRIYELEQELYRLDYYITHLSDEQNYELSLEELIGYGFEAR